MDIALPSLNLTPPLIQTFRDECRGAGVSCFLYNIQREASAYSSSSSSSSSTSGNHDYDEACLVQTALSLKHLLDAEALVFPLEAMKGPGNANTVSQLYYHTAAVQAAALDTATIAYREYGTSR